MAREIEQRRTDRARSAYDENRGARREVAAASQHLKGSEVRKRDAHCFGRIDAVRNRHEKARWPDRILCVAAHNTQVSHHLTLSWRYHAGTSLLDDANDLIARREWERPLEIWISAAPNHRIGKAGAGGEHPDTNITWARLGNR